MKNTSLLYLTLLLLTCCSREKEFDASGNFEADEVIVSAEQNGRITGFIVEEGSILQAGATVGQIDVKIAQLQKDQTEASIRALHDKTSNTQEETAFLQKQLEAQLVQLHHQQQEKIRTEKLVKADAATQKQLDDLVAQVEQLQKQTEATRQEIKLRQYNRTTQNRSIMSEQGQLEKAAEQFQEQVNRGRIINPIRGTVLTRYALKGELATIGKPLYKIADTDTLTLRAYITGTQLPQIKNGQSVTVRIDQGDDKYKTYAGTLQWISDKSEFTPKTIQTRDERANLVYAIKVRVKNDGYLKIGMYGEVLWQIPDNK